MYFCFGRFGPTWKEVTGAEIVDDGSSFVSPVELAPAERNQ